MTPQDGGELERLRGALEEAKRDGERDRATIEALRDAADEQRRETQHQVRNILSVVHAIARRTVAADETAEDYQARLESRLSSFTRLQNHILRNSFGGVDLWELISDELLAFGAGVGAKARIEGADTCLQPKPASVLGLAFHELACMSVDSGGMTGGAAHIDVRWHTEANGGGDDSLVIEWVETGWEAGSNQQSVSAFGRKFLEQAIAYELGGEVQLDVSEHGLACSLRLPRIGIVVS